MFAGPQGCSTKDKRDVTATFKKYRGCGHMTAFLVWIEPLNGPDIKSRLAGYGSWILEWPLWHL